MLRAGGRHVELLASGIDKDALNRSTSKTKKGSTFTHLLIPVLRPASCSTPFTPPRADKAIGIIYVRAFSLDSIRQAEIDSNRTATPHHDITAGVSEPCKILLSSFSLPFAREARPRNYGGPACRARPRGIHSRLGPQLQGHFQGRNPVWCRCREGSRGRLQVQDTAEYLEKVGLPAGLQWFTG
jgi:hypothetical protein